MKSTASAATKRARSEEAEREPADRVDEHRPVNRTRRPRRCRRHLARELHHAHRFSPLALDAVFRIEFQSLFEGLPRAREMNREVAVIDRVDLIPRDRPHVVAQRRSPSLHGDVELSRPLEDGEDLADRLARNLLDDVLLEADRVGSGRWNLVRPRCFRHIEAVPPAAAVQSRSPGNRRR